MKLYVAIFLVVIFHLVVFNSNLQYAEAQKARVRVGTTCYKCENVRNSTECKKEVVQCNPNEKSCKTTIRRVNGELRTTMKCAQSAECNTDEKQNEQNCPVKCVYCCTNHNCKKNQRTTEENCPSTRKGCRKILPDDLIPPMPCDKAINFLPLFDSNLKTINITGELRSPSSIKVDKVISNAAINSTVNSIKITNEFRLLADQEDFQCLKVSDETLLNASNNKTHQLKRDSLSIILRCYWEGKQKSLTTQSGEWSGEGSLFSGELYDGVSGEYISRDDDGISSTAEGESGRSARNTSLWTRPRNEPTEFLVTCFFLESSLLHHNVEPRAERLATCDTVQYLECVFIMKPLPALVVDVTPQPLQNTPSPQKAEGLGVAVISSIAVVSSLAVIIMLGCGVRQWKKQHSKDGIEEEN